MHTVRNCGIIAEVLLIHTLGQIEHGFPAELGSQWVACGTIGAAHGLAAPQGPGARDSMFSHCQLLACFWHLAHLAPNCG